jgi:hypothetical protein
MKVDKEVLLKQHFWILLSLLLVLPLVCLLVLWTSASAKVEEAEKTVKGTEDKLTKIKDPKNDRFVKKLEEKDEKVEAQKTKVWEAAWKLQSDLIHWPESLRGADKLNQAYFGDDIDLDTRFPFDSTMYRKQYDENIELVLPVKDTNTGQVQFLGGQPESVVPLSFSGRFEKRPPDSDDLWLLEEDVAVQRELLRLVRDTNDMIATFRKVPNAVKTDKSKGEIDHQVFVNSDFKLDLALAEEKGIKVFRCVLTNVNKRRLPLSWVPFIIKVKGLDLPQYFIVDTEPVAPNASVPVKLREKDAEKDWPLQTQSGTLSGEVLLDVRQVYDWRTAPIKRIDKVLMGVQSHRTQSPQVPPTFEKPATPPEGQVAQAPASTDTSTGGDTGGQMGMMGMMSRMKMMGGEGRGGFGGGSSDKTKNGFEKNRYMSASKQVRRMPIALALVMDQDHIQDFLTVVANSKLRVQTTQVYWQRFHDDIKPTFPEESKPGESKPGEETKAPGRTAGAPAAGKGRKGAMSEGAPGEDVVGRGGRAGKGAISGLEGGTGRAGTMAAMMQRMMSGRKGMMGGRMGMEGPDFGQKMTMPSAQAMSPQADTDTLEPEEQSNLVHLAFYGISSLYERYPPKKEGTETVSTTNP